ncbi:hypothetical protein OG689_23330 [Kitasatospora sp. NBC_00240]|uniref:BACON domain-containing protein n=1 Tax=Kitasatospora sp. NBC_00240 TaxID=2903567 RepID=UPI00224F2ED8|nr:hypothetical protein [Kitasatospora sp. NBC_00240]MCX5212178.1 hypothetical protein [Kitasatospora sp. NBC_00240]
MTTRVERSRNPVLAAYDRQLDGLFTYCLSVLCEHEAAVEAVLEVRELALRHGERLAEPGLLRAWLYSLARYCCLARLERGPGAPAPDGPPADSPAGAGAGPAAAPAGDHHGELAALAWPEAAGTDPEQREALELAVRHRLSPIEVAAVLGVPADTARALLASGGAEVRRTRAALLVLLVGSCPELDRLAGAGAESWCGPVSAGRGPQPDGGRGGRVLGPGLRRELVQHVVDCPTCRGTAERVAGEVREGLTGLPGLPMLTAPATARSGPAGAADSTSSAGAAGAGPDPTGPGRARAERTAPGLAAVPAPAAPDPAPNPASPANAHPARAARGGPGAAGGPARSGAPARPGGPSGPAGAAFLAGAAAGRRAARAAARRRLEEPGLRFDQRGFPRHRAPAPARTGAVRQRVLTTGVLAAVLAAPVVALWAGHQNGGTADAAATVSSVRVDDDGRSAGRRSADAPAASPLPGEPGADRTTGQTGGGLELAGALPAETLFPKIQGPAVPVPALGSTPIAGAALHSTPMPPPAAPGPAPVGLLTVEAAEYGSRTVITMTNAGGTEIHWHAVLDVDWLRLSRDAGTLAPGQRITVTVTVDEERAPAGAWTARIALPPSQAVVTLEGGPHQRGGSPSTPADPTTAPGTGPGTGPGPSTGPTAGTPADTPTGSPGTAPATPPGGPAPSTPATTPEPTGGPTPSPTDGGTAGATAAPSAPAASPSAGSPAPAGTGGRHQRAGGAPAHR